MIKAHQSPCTLADDTTKGVESSSPEKTGQKFLSPALCEATPYFDDLAMRHGREASLAAMLAITVDYAIRWNLCAPVAETLKHNAWLLEYAVRVRSPR